MSYSRSRATNKTFLSAGRGGRRPVYETFLGPSICLVCPTLTRPRFSDRRLGRHGESVVNIRLGRPGQLLRCPSLSVVLCCVSCVLHPVVSQCVLSCGLRPVVLLVLQLLSLCPVILAVLSVVQSIITRNPIFVCVCVCVCILFSLF